MGLSRAAPGAMHIHISLCPSRCTRAVDRRVLARRDGVSGAERPLGGGHGQRRRFDLRRKVCGVCMGPAPLYAERRACDDMPPSEGHPRWVALPGGASPHVLARKLHFPHSLETV